MSIHEQTFELTWPEEPTRVVRGRALRPGGTQKRPLPAVLVLHGFKGFMDWGFFPLFARGLAETGFLAVVFNTAGSGVGEDLVDFSDLASFERDTFSRQLEEVERVRQFVLEGRLGPVQEDAVGMVGHSRGGGVALLHAAAHPLQALVTWAAIDTVERFGDDAVERWRREGHLDIPNLRTGQIMRMGRAMLEDVEANREALDIVAAARRVTAPTLLIHGTHDEAVTPSSLERLGEALPNASTLLLEGAGHTFGAAHPLVEVGPDLERVLAATVGHLLEHLG
ncbi:MAG: alpha/beta fold hydrolase [Planctomycetota bacterium]|nr:alpha/beta fold hydrolase [Planctomycetota bacterium]